MKFFISKMILPIIFLSSSTLVNAAMLEKQKFGIIKVPVSDLRTKQIKSATKFSYPILSAQNGEQDSQLLLNEPVKIIETGNDGFVKVQALEQKKFLSNEWSFQTGWILQDQILEVEKVPTYNLIVKNHWAEIKTDSNKILKVSIGTKFLGKKILDAEKYQVNLPENQTGIIEAKNIRLLSKYPKQIESLREKLARYAIKFLDFPYGWGNRCSFNPELEIATSIDCSGFANLVFRIAGLDIPRDSGDQYLLSQKTNLEKNETESPLNGDKLKKSDLIFFANPETKRVNHVLIYLGNNKIVESTGRKGIEKNRIVTAQERLGKNIEDIKAGEECLGNIVYFGSYLNSPELLNKIKAA